MNSLQAHIARAGASGADSTRRELDQVGLADNSAQKVLVFRGEIRGFEQRGQQFGSRGVRLFNGEPAGDVGTKNFHQTGIKVPRLRSGVLQFPQSQKRRLLRGTGWTTSAVAAGEPRK